MIQLIYIVVRWFLVRNDQLEAVSRNNKKASRIS